MKIFWKYLRDYKGLLLLALLLAAINQIFSLLDPQITRLIIDDYATKVSEIPKEVFIKGVLLLLLAFIVVAFISRVAKNFQDYYVSVITQRMGTKMYSNSVEHTFSLPFNVFEDQKSGALLQKLQKARTDTQAMITSFINVVFLSLIGFLFVTIYAFTVHWAIAVTYLVIAPTIGGFIYVISKKIKEAQKNIVTESAELAGSTTETIRNVELVKSLGLEKQEINRLNSVNEKILQLELKKIKLIRILSFSQGTLINLVRAFLLFLMLWFVFDGSISIGEFFTLFIYSFFVFSPLGELGTFISSYQEAKASNEKLEEVLKIEPEKKPKDPVVVSEVNSIRFDKVSFSYNSSNSSIKDISFNIKKGETVAFAGPSGSGKTTIIKLILGLYKPGKGKILFNGVDSLKVDYDTLKKKIGFVSQETQLFAGTIKENLLFVNPSATDKQCLDVLKMASVMNIIERGDKGLDTKIGEGGIKISGGERQRLAIARALLRNPDIIVFDEATSSLDSLTEKEITKTIRDISKINPNLIIILVAHRLSTIAHSDRIYVMERGSIIEEGSHSKLVKKKGLYYALWREQSAASE